MTIQKSANGRLLALDILRGITISGMIMVNNPGSWKYIYAPLAHAKWNGLTPTDLVFPFFMFIMGVSTYISLQKFNFESSKETLFKIFRRTIIIFLIGLGVSWFSLSFRTFNNQPIENGFFDRLFVGITNFENLRILGVMQRLALTYCITSLVAIFVKHKRIPYIIEGSLFGYFLLQVLGNGFELSNSNIISIIDTAILGSNHMYKTGGFLLDPEGLVSTIPASCHVLIGFLCGGILMKIKDNQERIVKLFIIGAIMTFPGFLFSYACPINKALWSPSFVLVTCGMASTLLALLIWIIDIKGYKRWSIFFESFGVNPLFVYVLASILAILIGNIKFIYDDGLISIHSFLYKIVLQPIFGDYLGSLVFALLFVGIIWIVGNILYKKKIYIKI